MTIVLFTTQKSYLPQKYLLHKEWLSYEDLTKLLETAPSALENMLAVDHSVEFNYTFRFECTFCPRLCRQEFKEYRFENVARQGMRAHLKDHINNFKATMSDGEFTFLFSFISCVCSED